MDAFRLGRIFDSIKAGVVSQADYERLVAMVERLATTEVTKGLMLDLLTRVYIRSALTSYATHGQVLRLAGNIPAARAAAWKAQGSKYANKALASYLMLPHRVASSAGATN